MNQLILSLILFSLSGVIYAGGSSGTPTITDMQLKLLQQIQNSSEGLKFPVLQVTDQQYINLLATINAGLPESAGFKIGLTPQEILIKDGMPVIRMSHVKTDKPDVFVLAPEYFKSVKDFGNFYNQISHESANLPRLAP